MAEQKSISFDSFFNLFGKNYVHKPDGKTIKEVESPSFFKDGKRGEVVIAAYFSAHWCPPCRAFTPKLVEFYNKVNKDKKQLEIIFISSDQDDKAFEEYFSSMPWFGIPLKYDTDMVAQKYKVSGIPKLCVIDFDGTLLTGEARNDVANSSDAQKTLDVWKAKYK